MCLCAHVRMAVWSSSSAWREACRPWAVQPHRWRWWQRLWHILQADWPLQHTPLSESCSPLPILFQERGHQFQVVPALCVAQEPIQGSWSSSSSGAAHTGRAHCPSPVGRWARASQWPEHHSVVLRNCWESALCLVHVTGGWSTRLGWEMLYLLFKKIIPSMQSAAWAGSKVIVHLSLPWASLRAHASFIFPAYSDWMCLFRWPEQPS